MTILTPARLAEIRARAEKATPGPWQVEATRISWYVRPKVGFDVASGPIPHHAWHDPEAKKKILDDPAYIAALDPQTVLALITSHKALQAEVERLREYRDTILEGLS